VRRGYLIVLAALVAPLPAGAEAVLVEGQGRTLGWPVYDAQGQLGFADCQGQARSLSAGGSFVDAERGCPSPPAPFTLRGRVRAVTPEKSRLELVDEAGDVHMLYLGEEAAARLPDLPLDAPLVVEGPVAGHAARVSAPSP
jgi:hypothetical protein